MICCVQRVDSATVNINAEEERNIGKGLLVFIGVEKSDGENSCSWLADKVCGLRIFEDDRDRMSRSVQDIGGEIMVISQFTLSASCKKGKRPDFSNAMQPERAKMYYEKFVNECKKIMGRENVKTGEFGAYMKISLVNDGPVTILLDHK
ncbi:MAG: D-tyrosyl-tRNA(Tyr) deacylase [Flexistipes sinusarabici]|uniref:D-aminoacyl-tRNA deacylase n=1 Tax=Flexistipes sinusarabici TaxID=2352 RepID=A0A5D0MV39_FLESI|nr:D-aminoacyl-tRNA deacylase [Flexistipes sinusarabici]TYB36019.1 MAG: D-tyrosyl-tRNA(Tyr) deacylase [Flexistipes sinusarabici]